jgi:hypothetical protein
MIFIIPKIYIKAALLFVLVCLATSSIQAEATRGAKSQVLVKHKTAYEVVALNRLYFKYKPPMDVELPDGNILKAAKEPMVIPDGIKALDGQKVAFTGFVIPFEAEGNTIKRFLFSSELASCLFCQMLGFDQWVFVNVNDPKGFTLTDAQFEEPVTIYGTLEVSEQIEEGSLISLYRLKADGFESPRKKFLGII